MIINTTVYNYHDYYYYYYYHCTVSDQMGTKPGHVPRAQLIITSHLYTYRVNTKMCERPTQAVSHRTAKVFADKLNWLHEVIISMQ